MPLLMEYITFNIAGSRQPMLNGRHQSRESTDNEDQINSRRKAAKMLVAVVIMFGLCFFPGHLYNILRYIYVFIILEGSVKDVT